MIFLTMAFLFRMYSLLQAKRRIDKKIESLFKPIYDRIDEEAYRYLTKQ